MSRRFGVSLVLVVSVVLVHGTTAMAAEPEALASPTTVALVDVAYVFEHSDSFLAGKGELKERVSTLEAQGKTMGKILADLVKSVEKAEAGTAERDRREKDALTAKRHLEDFQRTAKANLLRSEATLYREEYARVQRAIREHAGERGIALVMRFQRGEIDDTGTPQEVIKSLNRQVLFVDEGLDITDAILQRLNDEYARRSD